MPEVVKEVLFDAHPKQQEFLAAVFSGKYRFVMFGGAIRGGKTYAGIGGLLLLCKKYPGSRWAIVRDSLPTLKRNTIPSFNKICPVKFIKTYNQDLQTVTFTNGSQILFFAENYDDDKELNRWKGLEVNGFLLEEANELQEVSFYKAIERAGSFIPAAGKTKPPPIIMMTCNPARNWVKKLIYDRWKDNTLPETWIYIPSKITDNPSIMSDADYVEQLKNMPRYEYEVFVNGRWDIEIKTGGEAYTSFELDKHVSDKVLKYDPLQPLHISWDENVNPYLPVGIFQVDRNDETGLRTIKWIDEIAAADPYNSVQKVCDIIRSRYAGHNAGMFIYGDATSNKQDTKLEKGYDFFRLILDYLAEFHPERRVPKVNPSVVQRLRWINAVLENEIGKIRVRINDKCKTAISDFVGIKKAPEGDKAKLMVTDPKTKVRYQQYGHFTDLFDYLICYLYADDFMKWQKGGTGIAITTGKNKSNNSY